MKDRSGAGTMLRAACHLAKQHLIDIHDSTFGVESVSPQTALWWLVGRASVPQAIRECLDQATLCATFEAEESAEAQEGRAA